MPDPIATALQTLGREISIDSLEASRVFGKGAGALLDGLRSRGYVAERAGRIALNELGQRALADAKA